MVIMVLIEQNLLNIFDVLGIVLNTEDIQLSKDELSKMISRNSLRGNGALHYNE